MPESNKPSVQSRTALDYRTRVCEAMNFISANLDRDLPLEEIASAASFSMFHFHRIFGAVVGETVAEFTRRLRLEKAANRLLDGSGDDVTVIALDCGFSSSQNFARAFRRRFGITPTEFRSSKSGHTASKQGNAASLMATYDPLTNRVDLDDQQGSTDVNGSIETLPAYHVAYVRKLGPYGKETCEAAFGELGRWAGPRGHFGKGTMLGVYWDNPEVTPPEKCRVDACISVPEGTEVGEGVALQTIEGGPHAVCRFVIAGDSFQQAWTDAFGWLIGQGLECADRPCFERYHADPEHHPEGKWDFDICIPLKR